MTMSTNRSPLFGFLFIFGLAGFIDFSSALVCADLGGVFSVDENTPVGYSILNVTAKNLIIIGSQTDPTTMNYIEAVQNNYETWSIVVNKTLDSEALTSSSLQYLVQCQDINDTRTQVPKYNPTIVVNDVNEYPPLFKKSPFNISLPESFPVNQVAFTIGTDENKAFDNDTKHVECSYSLLPNDYFEIANSMQGLVVLKKMLDYEAGPHQINLTIIAEELNTDEKLNSTNTLMIWITDVDDLNPEFSNEIYILTLTEGNYYGNEFYKTTPVVFAEDEDITIHAEINYRLDDSSKAIYGNLFSFNTLNGSMAINGTLTPGKYIVNLRAYQKDNPVLRYAIAVVTLTVTDINNHAPTIEKTQYEANVSELSPPGLTLLVVTAYDEDLGDNAAMEFHLTNNNDGVYEIITDQNRGSIILKKNLVRENKEIYTLQVYAQETKTKEQFRSNSSIITINVQDENDNAPVFSSNLYTFNVNRTASSGTTIGKVNATDQDKGLNGEVTYTLQSTSAPLQINKITGEITLTKSLSASDVGTFYVAVVATDNSLEVSRRRLTQVPVLIRVNQVNDNAPVFSGPDPYIINIPETTAANTVVGQAKAVDPDGDIVQYSIQSGNTGAYFNINPTTGDIILVQVNDLDSDTVPAPQTAFSIVLVASDGVHQTTKTMSVNFLYVNEYDPVFASRAQQNPTVNETATKGTYIATLKATDRDKGSDGNLTYMLTSSSNFVIDPISGVISLSCNSCLNYANQRSYDLLVIVADGGQPSRVAWMDLTVDISKTIQFPPRFSQKNYTFDVLESKENFTLFTLEASDPDSTNLRFYGENPFQPPEAPFYLSIIFNGEVTISKLDAERYSRIIMGARVSDGTNNDHALIIVNVIDVNDNDPKISMPSSIDLPENFELGKSVLKVNATDHDISNVGFTYFLDSGVNGKFQIDKYTGTIITNGQFDRRLKAAYNISITVMDHGTPPRYASGNLSVTITDSNTAPIFVYEQQNTTKVNEYTFQVPENTFIGSPVGVLFAYDPDTGSSGKLTFSIMDQGQAFLIGREDGTLTLAKNLNYETVQSYSFHAVVTDNSLETKSDTVTVKIIVLNIVEAPEWPLPLPVVYFTQTSSCSSQVRAFSREVTSLSSKGDEAVEYNLMNMTDAFSMNSSTGLLENTKSLNPRKYILGLAACSMGTTVCSYADLTVVVQSDDSLAFCPAFYEFSVNESVPVGTHLTDFNTTKGDNGITYKIISGNANALQAFRINENTGQLYVNGKLDRESVDTYTLIVSASLANTSQTAQAQAIIIIMDEPDTAPEFFSKFYQGEISESEQVGSAVRILSSPLALVIEAWDKDLNAKLSYSIEKASDTSNGAFQIDNATGGITLAKTVDFENIPKLLNGKYTFLAEVTDGYFSTSVNVTVNVIDANDNAPEFVDRSNIWLNVSEDTPIPKTLAVVDATDADLLDKNRLVYGLTLLRTNGQGNPFVIDSSTGELSLENALDRETTAEYSLIVSVKDLAGHTATKVVKVTVLDVNDNRPYFPTNVYKMNVSEGSVNVNGSRINITAVDKDLAENATISYNIISGDYRDYFNISKEGNETYLQLVKALDREEIFKRFQVSRIYLQITAIDSNQNDAPPSTCTVTVDVQDVNDNPPVFFPTQYNATVREDAVNGTFLSLNKNLYTTDQDSDGTSTIEYSLVKNDESSNFAINSKTGQMFLNLTGGPLDRETKEKYVIEVIATDDFGKGLSATATVTVYIEDVNDEKPHFVIKHYNFSIPENSQLGTSVGFLYANDSDLSGGLTLYYLTGFMFSIDRLNGTIRVTGNLDRESMNEYNLTATACDSDPKIGCDDATVTITILDINDCCPVWNSTSLSLIFSESETSFPKVGQLFAVDDDLDQNGTVAYFINDTETQKYFNVTPEGEVILLKVMESSLDIPRFPVYAKDGGIPPCIQKGYIQVKVQGINKFSPEIGYNGSWGVKEIKLTVPTKARPGTVIGQVNQRDNDTGRNGETYISLLGIASNFLNISGDGFIVVLKEITAPIEGILWIVDKGINPKNSSCSLQVTVLNSPENPVFTNISYIFSVNETKNLVFIGTVTALVQGGGKQPQYSILTDGVPFRVEVSNGTIFSTSELDREKIERFPFIISASVDESSRTLASVIVKVLDVSDNRPTFEASNITVTVQEGITKVNLVQLSATDADDGPNKVIIYHLLNPSGYFSIENKTGIVSVIAPLDRENVKSYDLYVEAIDGGDPKLTSTATIHVEVTDINDNPPVFKQPSYAFNVTASKIVPQKLFSVNATDSDYGVNQQIIYVLDDSEDSNSFSIDPFTGQISTVKHLDLDRYSFVVKAHDLGTPSLTGNASIIINVRHEDIFPQLSVSVAATTLFVGMTKGYPLNVSITSQDAIKVSITGGNENKIFELDNNNLKLADELTVSKDYQLVLTAVSLSGLNTSKTILVMVKNLEFNQTNYLAAVLENFAQVPKIICTLGSLAQSLNVPVIYSLDNYREEFKVDQITGELSVIKVLDREITPLYVVNVSIRLQSSSQNRRKRQVNDKGGQASVVVQVIDVNDNPPSFGNRGSQFRLTVPSDAKANALITTLKAFDPDEGENSVIFYKIIQGDTTTFKINSSTGELRVANPAGLKPQTDLYLTISATGINDPGQGDTLNITISVQSIYQFSLIASIPKSIFEQNQKEILGNLSQILGYTIQLESINVHKENGDVDTDRSDLLLNAVDPKTNETIPISQIQSKITEKQRDITKLFDSYTTSKRVSSSDEDSFGVASIALLVVACVMFVVSLGAILVAYLLWKKQRHYAQKEESAAKVRQRMEEQLVQKKGTSLSSDPDEHLEMTELPDVTEEQERIFVFETEFKNDISTLALRRHIVDVDMQKMQQLFQAAAGEDTEEPYHTLTNESETDDDVVNYQTNRYVESLGQLLNGQRDTGVIYEEDETTDNSSDDSSVFSSEKGLIKQERTSISSKKEETVKKESNQHTSGYTKTLTDNTGYVNSNVLPFLSDIKMQRKGSSDSSIASLNSEVEMSSTFGPDQPNLRISNFYQSPPSQAPEKANGHSVAEGDPVPDDENSLYSSPIKLKVNSSKELPIPSPDLVKEFFSEDPTISTIRLENIDIDDIIEESTHF